MRVLWFTNTPSLYKKTSSGYNGGGWISSLEAAISCTNDFDLAVSFLHSDNTFKVKQGKTTYYPISIYNTALKKIKHNLLYNRYDNFEVKKYLKVIDDFKPDVIHIFGSEQSFGLITQHINIPVVIHVQGILNPYLNAIFAPGTNSSDYFKYYKPFKAFIKYKFLLHFTYNAIREEIILKNCKHFIGRTKWDRSIVHLYRPDANYYYGSEILRKEFYDALPWKNPKNESIKILSTISDTDYKGFDLILKTAKMLKHLLKLKFEWIIYGLSNHSFWEKKLHINANEVDVKLMGVASATKLIEVMQTMDIFIHPSYIDNSPNSICEAQLLGMPIIATNVGGISSLIKDNESGFLVPANDPFTMSSRINELINNSDLAYLLGKKARLIALERHNVDTIVKQNLSVYHSILHKNVD